MFESLEFSGNFSLMRELLQIICYITAYSCQFILVTIEFPSQARKIMNFNMSDSLIIMTFNYSNYETDT